MKVMVSIRDSVDLIIIGDALEGIAIRGMR